MMMAAGGAVSDNLESRLIKDATSVDGKCLASYKSISEPYRKEREYKRGAQE
jgi:hypothetical protein